MSEPPTEGPRRPRSAANPQGAPPAQQPRSAARSQGSGSAAGRQDAPSTAGPKDGPAAPGSASSDGAQEPKKGPELARAVIEAAFAKRRAAPRRTRQYGAADPERRLRGYSGPGPDPRDPQPFAAVLERLMRQRGWEKPKAEATVFGAWEKVVGEDIAKHSRPIKLDAGVLTVEAESTAWATQLRMLAASLLRSIAVEVGHNVVTRLNIHGPTAPSWSRGPRRVQGRGPRDTYG